VQTAQWCVHSAGVLHCALVIKHEALSAGVWSIGRDSRFQSEPGRPKAEAQLWHGTDSENAIWFIAPAKEQFALVTDDGFHEFPFG
jgi:hypothetical protein